MALQGFSKVLFPTSGGREERKWGHLGAEPRTPRLGTAVPKNPARLLRSHAWLYYMGSFYFVPTLVFLRALGIMQPRFQLLGILTPAVNLCL